jgi:hypothetical protein
MAAAAAARSPRHLRVAVALYLFAFLLGSSIAPHRHANGEEDLFEDGPSDSGVVLAGHFEARDSLLSLFALQRIDDDPCPACFTSDFPGGLAMPHPSLSPPRARAAGSAVSGSIVSASRPRLVASRAPPAAA